MTQMFVPPIDAQSIKLETENRLHAFPALRERPNIPKKTWMKYYYIGIFLMQICTAGSTNFRL